MGLLRLLGIDTKHQGQHVKQGKHSKAAQDAPKRLPKSKKGKK